MFTIIKFGLLISIALPQATALTLVESSARFDNRDRRIYLSQSALLRCFICVYTGDVPCCMKVNFADIQTYQLS